MKLSRLLIPVLVLQLLVLPGSFAQTAVSSGASSRTTHATGTPIDLNLSSIGGDGYGMARASFYTMQAALNIFGTPLSYKPSVGPAIDFNINYNYMETLRPSTFTFSNLGPGWSFNWIAYLTLNASKNARVIVPGGSVESYKYKAGNNGSNEYLPNLNSHVVLAVVGDGTYQRRLPDGSVEVYNLRDNNGRVFMTQVIDRRGNAVQITYDANFRLSSITDAVGQTTTVTYVSDTVGNAGFYKIAKVTDPFGRGATFAYDSTMTHLVSSTGTVGLVSQFTYDPDTSFISAMTTPYGTTSFHRYTPPGSEPGSRGLRFTFPDGTTSVAESWAGETKKTYYWDRNAMTLYPSDPADHVYTHCTTTKWLSDAATGAEIPVKEFVKEPLENAVTYTYEGQTEQGFVGTSNLPIRITRQVKVVNPDGTAGSGTQTYSYQYNALGHITKEIDPVGRTLTYKYADNNVDLLEIRQTRGTNNDLIAKWEYNDKHLPTLYIDGSGQRTRYTYNSLGKLTKLTDANKNTWTMTYDAKGSLTTIDGPLSGSNGMVKYTYDKYSRRHSMTDATGQTLTYSYDNADRITKITYPDGTSEQIGYDKHDAVVFKDRQGRQTKRTYDSMDQLVSVVDPLGRKTQYNWCACGSLTRLIDPLGQLTNWEHDLEGRVIRKTYPDQTAINYVYEDGGTRIQSRTDALNQTTNYTYNMDDTLAQITYANTVNPTSTVTRTYDPDYRRVTSIQNGWGTLTYEYNPRITDPDGAPTTGGGNLRSVSNSVIPNSTTTYHYDACGRTVNRSVNGSDNSDTWTFDALRRMVAEANTLGEFRYNYVENTSGSPRDTLQVSSISYPNGQVANFSYYENTGDKRLREIKNLSPSAAVLSQFDYAYNPAGEIIRWAQHLGDKKPVQYDLGYDPAGQLLDTQSTSANSDPSFVSEQYHYAYDAAGNRTLAQSNAGASQASYNSVNELMNLASTGGSRKLSYDANGNLVNDGINTYQWDAENRLIQINYPGTGNTSQFTYDGVGQCVKIVEMANTQITSTKQFVWCQSRMCEIRDSNGVVLNKLFPLGESVSGKNYYYTKDHLNSTRELTDGSGKIQAQYGYDPYGRSTRLQGSVAPSVQYAGYYLHEPSGLNLTLFRGYSSEFGRWISRDPAGELFDVTSSLAKQPRKFDVQSANLYAYVNNDPIKFLDPLGLAVCQAKDKYTKLEPKYGSQDSTRLEGKASETRYTGDPVVYNGDQKGSTDWTGNDPYSGTGSDNGGPYSNAYPPPTTDFGDGGDIGGGGGGLLEAGTGRTDKFVKGGVETTITSETRTGTAGLTDSQKRNMPVDTAIVQGSYIFVKTHQDPNSVVGPLDINTVLKNGYGDPKQPALQVAKTELAKLGISSGSSPPASTGQAKQGQYTSMQPKRDTAAPTPSQACHPGDVLKGIVNDAGDITNLQGGAGDKAIVVTGKPRTYDMQPVPSTSNALPVGNDSQRISGYATPKLTIPGELLEGLRAGERRDINSPTDLTGQGNISSGTYIGSVSRTSDGLEFVGKFVYDMGGSRKAELEFDVSVSNNNQSKVNSEGQVVRTY